MLIVKLASAPSSAIISKLAIRTVAGLQFHRLAFAGQLVGGLAGNFLCGEGGGICSISPWKRLAAART